jgi:glutamate formiminotransferase / 5-formyltetrahydrofolate cyclo-ligase
VTSRDLASAVNVSEGRDAATIDLLAEECAEFLLDVHRDGDHHRSVLTLAGPADELLEGVRRLVDLAMRTLDLTGHVGVHPRFGVVDVVPFTPIGSADLDAAIEARDKLAIWAGAVLGIPCFLYGPMPDGGSRSLPDVRRGAFSTLIPDTGPSRPHPSAGAMAIGARGPLVAYNLWVDGVSLAQARDVARRVRNPSFRALGLAVGQHTQVSCNLVEPEEIGPAEAYDLVAWWLPRSAKIAKAELVGLIPESVLARVPKERWLELGLSAADGLEARLRDRSLRKRRS